MARKNAKSKFPPAFLQMLKEAGYTPHSASLALGGADLLRNFGRGRSRTLRGDSLIGLANLLGRPVDEVAAALGLPSTPSDIGVREHSPPPGFDANYPPSALRRPPRSGAQLIVRYVVQAGAWIEHDDVGQERLPGPPVTADHRFDPDLQWLELVRGDSADLFYREGAWVHVVDAIGIGYAPRAEDFVVVTRKRHQNGTVERTLKQIEVRNGKIELWPRSSNSRWRAPLVIDPQADSDDTETVEIAALVLGGYLPTPRR